MLYIIPTKRGIGIEIWGTYDDLNDLYGVILKFSYDENYEDKNGFKNRNKLISGFSYEIRKAKEGQRLTRKKQSFFYTTETAGILRNYDFLGSFSFFINCDKI